MLASILSILSLVLPFLIKLFPVKKASITSTNEQLGTAKQQVSDLQQAVKAEAAIAKAEASAPSTVAGVEDRLKEGTF